jgi:hypothetical protein
VFVEIKRRRDDPRVERFPVREHRVQISDEFAVVRAHKPTLYLFEDGHVYSLIDNVGVQEMASPSPSHLCEGDGFAAPAWKTSFQVP